MATPPDGDDSTGQLATIKVMSPAPQLTINFVLPLDLTIRELKDRITESLESRPDHTHQRLIYRGKFLQDGQSIGGVLKASANGEDVGLFPGPINFMKTNVTFNYSQRSQTLILFI